MREADGRDLLLKLARERGLTDAEEAVDQVSRCHGGIRSSVYTINKWLAGQSERVGGQEVISSPFSARTRSGVQPTAKFQTDKGPLVEPK